MCRNPTLAKCEDETHTPKVGDLESSGTPESLELNNKAQNTSHWGVLSVIGKFLKRRYQKWSRIGHLDICSPSYGQKKGRESNWQFDSRPQKSGIDLFPTSDSRVRYGIGKLSRRVITLVLTSLQSDFAVGSYKLPKSRDSNRDSLGTFETPTWESQEKEPFGCSLCGELQSILYGGRWWLPPSSGCAESYVSKCPWLIPTPKGVFEC